MSVDFAVFDPSAITRDAKAFRHWYDRQVDWDDEAADASPEILSAPLKAWYEGMTARFPDLIRSDADGPEAIDYCFTPRFMYCSMPATRSADEAWSAARTLAGELGLGTYDCMSDDGRNNRAIVFPDGPLENEPSFFKKLFGRA